MEHWDAISKFFGPMYGKDKAKGLITDGGGLSKANIFSFDGRKVFNKCINEDEVVKPQIYLPMLMANAIYNYDSVLMDDIEQMIVDKLIKNSNDFPGPHASVWTPVIDTALYFGDVFDDFLYRFDKPEYEENSVWSLFPSVFYSAVKSGDLEKINTICDYGEKYRKDFKIPSVFFNRALKCFYIENMFSGKTAEEIDHDILKTPFLKDISLDDYDYACLVSTAIKYGFIESVDFFIDEATKCAYCTHDGIKFQIAATMVPDNKCDKFCSIAPIIDYIKIDELIFIADKNSVPFEVFARNLGFSESDTVTIPEIAICQIPNNPNIYYGPILSEYASKIRVKEMKER